MNTPKNQCPPVYRSFEDLEVYKAMREFRKAMYRVAKRLPDLADQDADCQSLI